MTTRIQGRRTATGRTAVVLLAAGLASALVGCSGDHGGSAGAPTSGANGLKTGSVAGGAAGQTVGPGPKTTPTPAPKPVRATCSMLPKKTAAALLGSAPTGRSADTRQWPAGVSELDGCAYTASGGAALQYVVWSTATGAAATLTPPAVPGNAPAQRFNPGIGQSSAGVSITTGDRTTVEISAHAKGRLVQVTASMSGSTRARHAATEAAKTLISAR